MTSPDLPAIVVVVAPTRFQDGSSLLVILEFVERARTLLEHTTAMLSFGRPTECRQRHG